MTAPRAADSDLVPNDKFGYRIAFIEAFGARGIPADGVRTLSPESLRWQTLQPDAQPPNDRNEDDLPMNSPLLGASKCP